jgi:hypothetical protein
MRDDVLMELVDKAINDPEFRAKAKTDLQGTLQEYNINLTPDELTAVQDFHAQTSGLSDDELNEQLANAPRRQMVG